MNDQDYNKWVLEVCRQEHVRVSVFIRECNLPGGC